jgi:colicin import membrane protein
VVDAAADATDAAEADKADLANKATDAIDANGANKADAVNKPNKADKAKADDANKAKADEADKAIATEEVNKAIKPTFRLDQQVDEANDAKADETDEAIGASVSVEVINSDNEDEVLDNQLTELEKLDAANKAIVSNEAGELSELTVIDNNELIVAGSDELDEFVEADDAV